MADGPSLGTPKSWLQGEILQADRLYHFRVCFELVSKEIEINRFKGEDRMHKNKANVSSRKPFTEK